MMAIGKGMMVNDKVDTLLLKGNHIDGESLEDLMEAFEKNKNLKVRILDLSSNRINVRQHLQF